ncbi:hypothetical protein VTG60DRAFT_625 [Thermothelomyces hinnuleus]
MDKVKDTMKKGLEKATKTGQEPLQEDKKDTLQTAWPATEQHQSMTGGPDLNLARASHSGDPTGLTGKASLGQPSNKPQP